MFRSIFFAASTACLIAQVENKSIHPINPTHKVALVIGNSNYAYVPKIPPAVNDAADMAAALRRLGFTVEMKTDLGGEALVETVGHFSRSKVQPGDVTVVYYSGHGGQVSGENYLLPVDYQPPSNDDLVDRRAYRMSLVRDALERTGASVRVLIFDACRDSPVTTTKSVSSGLRGLSGKAEGTLIAFASADNQVARYETGQRNSFYTAELVSALNRNPGDLKTLLEQVQQRVFTKTGRQQTPYLYGFLSAPLYLGAEPPPAEHASLDLDMERYQAVKDSRDPAQLEAAAARLQRADLAEILRERAKALRSSSSPTSSPATAQAVDLGQLTKRADAAFDSKDYLAAADLYRQLADRADAWGMFRLGYLYDIGNGVAQNNEAAVLWYRKAAQAGNGLAMNNLGILYKLGQGVPTDLAQAAAWYRKAADAGVPTAMFNLGKCYKDGIGVQRNVKEALAWIRKSADKDDPTGMDMLGYMYETGEGIPKDPLMAVFWYTKAAAVGNPMGMFNLGWVHEQGIGVTKNLEQAVSWYKRGADAGSEDCKKALQRLGR
jgi:TPR repeat protein